MDNSAEEVTDELPIELPRWLEDLLPEQRVPQRLSTVISEGGSRVLRLTDPNGSDYSDFDSIAEVAEANRTADQDLTIDDEVYEHFSERGHLLSYPYPNGKSGYVGILFSHTDQRRRESLESSYRTSLENQSAYEGDPTSFILAYRFIDSHPAFWTSFDVEKHPWHWETQGYCSKIRQSVWSKDDGGYRISLEGGGHVEISTGPGSKPYTEHYGDWRLEATADSFEEAIVGFAARLILAFDSEGNSLSEDGFPYPVPEWVQELKIRTSDEEL